MKHSLLANNTLVLAYCLIILFVGIYTEGVAQVAINTDGSNPSTNMILDLNPAVGKAFAPPAMTWAQIKAISPVKAGMFAYDTEFNCLRMYNGTKWVSITEQTDISAPPGSFTTQTASGTINIQGIATDASSNVYVTGYFSGTATVGILPAITSSGNQDIFIAKYNSSGTALWVQKAGGLGTDNGNSIAVDASGNIYITGSFQGTATFGALSSIVSAGNTDIFIAKYNSSGTALWVQKAGGINVDIGLAIAIDVSGSIYIAGAFSATATFGVSTLVFSAGSFDIFVAKYNSSGILQWVQRAGGLGSDFAKSIAIDASNNVNITGAFEGTATFGAAGSLVSVGTSDIFVTQLVASSGQFVWVKKAGGLNDESVSSITTDALGNIFIIGYFSNSLTFGIYSTTSTGGDDFFIAKYNSSGTEQWIRREGGIDDDRGRSIALDALNNIYITGSFRGTVTFGSLPPITPAGGSDIFIAKYDSNGTAQWVQKAGGLGTDEGHDITTDALGNIYTTGSFNPSAQFGKQVLTSGTMFLMKYSE